MPEIIFGTNTCFAVKRWPEPEEWARIAADLELHFVQFSFDVLDPVIAGTPAYYDHIRAVCEQRDIVVSSAFTGYIAYSQNLLGHPDEGVRARAEEWYEKAIAATARLGARGCGGHIGAVSVRDFEDKSRRVQAFARTREAVLRLSGVAAQHGLDFLLWEVMPVEREYPAHMEDVRELLTEVNDLASIPIKLCLDVGHACLSGAGARERNPYAWLEQLGPHAHSIHLQQTDGAGDRHWPFTAETNTTGIIEPVRIVDLVSRLPQAEVELMLEPVHAFEAPDSRVLQDLGESVSYWSPWIDILRARSVRNRSASSET